MQVRNPMLSAEDGAALSASIIHHFSYNVNLHAERISAIRKKRPLRAAAVLHEYCFAVKEIRFAAGKASSYFVFCNPFYTSRPGKTQFDFVSLINAESPAGYTG